MSNKLVELARRARTSLGESLHFGLCAELADCVEKLEAKNDKLEQQLAKALAACKQKDSALVQCMEFLETPVEQRHIAPYVEVNNALALQPDDAALKAWLGEPVGEVKRHTGSLKDMAIIVWSGEQPEEGAQLYIKPKGLK